MMRMKLSASAQSSCASLGSSTSSLASAARWGVVLSTILSALLSACTLRPPLSGEERTIDSVTLAPDLVQGAVAQPFCLHLSYHNTFFVVGSDNRTEAWITDGPCATPGPKRAVESLRLSWWNDWYDSQQTRQCLQSDVCSVNDQNAVEGRNIRCASAQARQGNQTAFITTDQAVCH